MPGGTLFEPHLYRYGNCIFHLFKQAADSGAGDAAGLCDVGQTVAPVAVPKNSDPVDLDWTPADMPALQPCAAHSCSHPCDDKVAFQFFDGADDDDDGPPQWATRVEVLPEADELDLQMVESIQHLEEVPDGPGDPVRSPHQHHLEAAAAGIAEQVIKARSAGLRSRDSVGVLGYDLKASLLGHGSEVMELCLRVLVHSGYAQI